MDGDTDTISIQDVINVVPNQVPIANFTMNVTVASPNSYISFTFSGSEGDAPATFQWNFGDGSSISTEKNPTHQYSTSGNYTVNLTVIDKIIISQ